jgi:hypothetical protein
MTEKALPRAVTSIDVLKSVAVVIMIIDHIGYYFFPDHLMWRAVGRVGFPVWFFLVGYARGREISSRLFLGAAILLLANMLVGMPLVPLNALFTIMAIRLLLDRYTAQTFKDVRGLLASCAVLAVLIFPTVPLTEYGTLAFITAMFGYVIRNRPGLNADGLGRGALPWFFAFFTFVTFVVSEQLLFKFDTPAFIVMAAGTALTIVALFEFRTVTFEKTASWPEAIRGLFHIGGRRTLEIYVLHLCAFKIIAALLYPARYHWFHVTVLGG